MCFKRIIVVAFAFTGVIYRSVAAPSGSATESLNAPSQSDYLNVTIGPTSSLDNVTQGPACVAVRQLALQNSSIHDQSTCGGEPTTQVGEPFYQMTVSFSGGRPLPRENLFKTFAYSLDFALYEWSQRHWQEGTFQPANYYNIKIDFQRDTKASLHRDFPGWLIDTIVFWMRDKNTFAEMTGQVFNKAAHFGEVKVQLIDADSAALSNETFSGGIDDSLVSLNANLSSESAKPSSLNPGSAPPTSKRDEITTNQTAEGKPLTAPHRFQPQTIKTKFVTKQRMGDESIELDLMSALFCVGRQATIHARQPRYACHMAPDRTAVEVTPVLGRQTVSGKDMVESLVDIVDWQYSMLRALGNFYSFEALTEKSMAGGWTPTADWSLYLK